MIERSLKITWNRLSVCLCNSQSSVCIFYL
jgi:hypothetical protein